MVPRVSHRIPHPPLTYVMSTTCVLRKHVTLCKSLLKSASSCLWTPGEDGSASAGGAAERPLRAPRGKGSRVSLGRTSLGWTALRNARLTRDVAVPVRKERLSQTLLSGNSFKKKSSCPLDCPLLRCHICIHGLAQGSMALDKSCDLTHGQNVFKYISWWRSYHSNVCRGIFKRSYTTVLSQSFSPCLVTS